VNNIKKNNKKKEKKVTRSLI